MAKPGKGRYSDSRYQVEQELRVTSDDISLAGTQAAAAELARTTAFSNIRILEGAIEVLTGGTAAGPAFTINKSAAGTGALTAFGTGTFGTNADSTVIDVTLTETAIADGDDIVLQSVAGTAAETPTFNFKLGYVENFVLP